MPDPRTAAERPETAGDPGAGRQQRQRVHAGAGGAALEAEGGAPGPDRTLGAASARWAGWLFVCALVVHALPPLLLTRFPTQDGPLHVENVLALLRLDHVEVLRDHLAPNWGLQPNWTTQLLFAALAVAAGPLIAQRLVLAGALVALPLAVRYALPATPRGRWAALAVFPFLYSFPFLMGFWNFSYGLALLFVVVGAWRRTRGRITARSGAALAAVLVLAYFTHTVAVSASLVAIGVVTAWRGALAYARARPSRRRRRLVLAACARRGGALALAFAPALVLLGQFLAAHRGHHAVRLPFATMVGKLISLYALVSVDRREVLLSIPVAASIAALVTLSLLRRRWSGERGRARPADGWVATAAVFALLYLATPDVAASGAQISDRLALLPFLAAIAWLGHSSGPVRDVRRLACVLLALSATSLALRAPRWLALDRDLGEYVSIAGAVPRGSVLLPITFQPYGLAEDGTRQAWRIRPFQHAAGYIAAERDALDLDDAQLATDYAPVRLARGPLPASVLGPGDALEGDPPCVDLEAWRRAGGRLDTILLYGATPENTRDACSRRMLDALRAGFRRVAVSRPRGLVEVYRSRPAGSAPQRTAAR